MGSVRKKEVKLVSVVIPALNENALKEVVLAIPQDNLKRMGFDVQVLVVVNSSEDKTAELARKAGAEVVYEARRGYGRACKAGFASATGNIIAVADADATYPVEDIPSLVKLLEDEKLDFITTNRLVDIDERAMSQRNRLGNRALSLMLKLLFRINIEDSQSGMWVLRKSILDELKLRSEGMSFSEELKVEACYFTKRRWREVPVRYRQRVGKTKLHFWSDGLRNLLYLVKKRFVR